MTSLPYNPQENSIVFDTYEAIDKSNLSLSTIGNQWSEISDTSSATLINRVGRWRRDGLPESIGHWVELMSVLGYDVILEKRFDSR